MRRQIFSSFKIQYSTSFKQICEELNASKAEKHFQKLPQEEKNTENFYFLFKTLSNTREYEKLEKYFNLMIKSNVRPSQNAFTIIQKFALDTDIYKCRNYFNLMSTHQFVPSIRFSTKYLSTCYKHKLPHFAQEFDDQFGHKLDRDSLYFNIIIQGNVHNSNLTKAIEYFGKMIQLEIQPDIYTFTSLIKGYLQIKDFETAMRLLSEMKNLNIKPNVVTYGVFLSSFSEDFRQERLEMILEMMNKDEIVFNVKINSMLIKLYCDTDNIEKALEIYNSQSVKDIYFLNTFIHYYAEKGNLLEMNKFYKNFETLGLKPDTITFGSLIQGYVGQKEFEKAEELLKENFKLKVPISDKTINYLVRGYCDHKLIKKAEDLLGKLPVYKLKPTRDIMTNIMKCYYDLHEVEKAKKCFLMMRNESMQPTIYSYCLNFLGLFQNNQKRDLKRSLQSLLSKSELNASYAKNIKK
jgi:pentatricopeptide repeat protein